jgi:CRP-like cAMP-binding protein
MEELILLLQGIHPLSRRLESHLRSIIRKHSFKKKEFLLKIGEVSHDILFLQKGLVRSYSLVDDEEVSNWFMKEGDICISVVSFLHRRPAVDNIQALENCECWGITFAELMDTYKRFLAFNIHGRIITGEYYVQSEIRNHSKTRRSPQDKYKLIMETNPDLVKRIPVRHLASYLDVSLRTLTEIRRAYSATDGKID